MENIAKRIFRTISEITLEEHEANADEDFSKHENHVLINNIFGSKFKDECNIHYIYRYQNFQCPIIVKYNSLIVPGMRHKKYYEEDGTGTKTNN